MSTTSLTLFSTRGTRQTAAGDSNQTLKLYFQRRPTQWTPISRASLGFSDKRCLSLDYTYGRGTGRGGANTEPRRAFRLGGFRLPCGSCDSAFSLASDAHAHGTASLSRVIANGSPPHFRFRPFRPTAHRHLDHDHDAPRSPRAAPRRDVIVKWQVGLPSPTPPHPTSSLPLPYTPL